MSTLELNQLIRRLLVLTLNLGSTRYQTKQVLLVAIIGTQQAVICVGRTLLAWKTNLLWPFLRALTMNCRLKGNDGWGEICIFFIYIRFLAYVKRYLQNLLIRIKWARWERVLARTQLSRKLYESSSKRSSTSSRWGVKLVSECSSMEFTNRWQGNTKNWASGRKVSLQTSERESIHERIWGREDLKLRTLAENPIYIIQTSVADPDPPGSATFDGSGST